MLLSCSRDRIFSEQQLLLGTVVQVTVITDDDARARRAMDAAFAEIARIEARISYYREDSDIARINAAAGRPVKVSDETIDLIRRCDVLSRNSGGAFDISFAPVGRLWKFGAAPRLPSPEDLQAALALVDYRKIHIDGKNGTVRLERPGMAIGLGSIGKRYAIGRAVAVLKENGIADALVLTGGDLQVLGTRFGRPWVVGVKHPRGEGLLYNFPASPGETISTSGDYERQQMIDGKRYHHIFDPRTGYPTETFASVTVISSVPEYADGLSTAIMVVGKNGYRQLLDHYPGVLVILVDVDMNVAASRELKDRLRPLSGAPVVEWL